MGYPLGPITHFAQFLSRTILDKIPTIPTNIVCTCHVGLHVDFPSLEITMRCSPCQKFLN